MGLFSSGSSKVKIVDPLATEKRTAATSLLDLFKQGTPTIPALSVAGMTPTEQTAQDILSQWVGTTPEGYSAALPELIKTATGGYTDITKTPWFEPVVQRGTEEMNLAANRIARMLQKGGMLTSGPGESILARTIREGGENIVGTLAPYAQTARGEQMNAIVQLLSGVENQNILQQLAATQAYGGLPRQIQDAINQALYQSEMTETTFPYTYLANLLQPVLGANIQTEVTQPEPSLFSQIAPLIGSLGSAYIMNKGISGGGTTPQTYTGPQTYTSQAFSGGSNMSSDLQTALQIAQMVALAGSFASDERLKENFGELDDSLEKVRKLKGKTYNYKTDTKKTAGLIAQDVEKVLPEAVVEINGVKAIKLDSVLALLINAFNEAVDKKAA
jgi:hypothetical protein